MQDSSEPQSTQSAASFGSMAEQMYAELRRLASAKLAHLPAGVASDTTSLVHEVYVRLMGRTELRYRDDREFFLVAARSMRDVLVERARKSASVKAGGGRRRVDFSSISVAIELDPTQLIAFDEILQQIKSDDAVDYDIVMLRFYSGLTESQAAEAMNLPLRSFQRRWHYLRVKLYRQLSQLGLARDDAESGNDL